jgi:RNA polymerase sigma-70 factor (ECF subfamily)
LALRQEELTSLCDDVDLDRDRALVERCQAGDSAAFGNLYARYYDRLLRFCLRRLSDRHEAEDAAQEAFARAWKALPQFAGERRFYPWLTVIAGNICTDMLRRRSRSTPTDDMELTAHQPVGVVSEDTSEELVLAAVDGELVNRALDRLSVRHRHVLAMREGSGWTYQQIADHEGVEIGTIETLLWRARQALKREFAVVSESKEALAGFLIAAGALIRRSVFRAAHRGASLQSQGNASGTGSAFRTAVTGVAVTGAAVAAALITPHALSSNSPAAPLHLSGGSGSALADPPLALTTPTPVSAGTGATGASGLTGNSGSATGAAGGLLPGGSGSGGAGIGSKGTATVGSAGSNLGSSLGSSLNGLSGGLTNTPTGQAVSGVVNNVGGTLNQATGGLTGGLTNTLSNTVSNLSNSLGVNGLLGGVGSAVTGSGSSSGSSTTNTTMTPTSTTTTAPNLLGGLGQTVGSSLNGLLGGS